MEEEEIDLNYRSIEFNLLSIDYHFGKNYIDQLIIRT
jgi:hypothetical protein